MVAHRQVAAGGAGVDARRLVARLRQWAHELGFSQIGVSGVDLGSAEAGLRAWLQAGFHGSMGYMAAHDLRRARPAELRPGTVSIVTARMDYLPRTAEALWADAEAARLRDPRQAVISIYARGRDYHKVLRARLQALAERLRAEVGPFGHRVFVDSAPVLEVELAVRSGLGWRGKHTLALDRTSGSMFFLGELFVDLELPAGEPVPGHCGTCSACLDACPTGAIVAPYRLDARRCISYLTIEHDGAIPQALRRAVGNRVYGCDDCQLVCPWNKYARRADVPDFDVRHGLDRVGLLELWRWDEAGFLHRTEGSAIRRIGWERWRRNLAVALGNALQATGDARIADALAAALATASPMVREHIEWALLTRADAAGPAPAAAPPSPPGSTA